MTLRIPAPTLVASALAIFTLAPTATAQAWVGWGRDCATEISAYSRHELGLLAGEVITRLDSSEHAGWGSWAPGTRTITGVQFATSRGPTPQSLDIVFYREGAPDQPNLAFPYVFCPLLPVPAGLNCITIIKPPVQVPIAGTGDIFLSFKLPAPVSWPLDGIGVGTIAGDNGAGDDYAFPTPALLNFDKPGSRLVGVPSTLPNGSHGLQRIGLGAATYVTTRQSWFDLQHRPRDWVVFNPGAGGVGITTNTQTNYLAGANGTSTFLSGSHPHVDDSTANGNLASRCDSIGMGISMPGLAGHFVVFAIQLNEPFGPELDLNGGPFFAPPGSTGVLCLDPFAPTIAIAMPATSNVLEVSIPVPCHWSLSGIEIVQQAFALHSTGRVHATPCDRMKL